MNEENTVLKPEAEAQTGAFPYGLLRALERHGYRIGQVDRRTVLMYHLELFFEQSGTIGFEAGVLEGILEGLGYWVNTMNISAGHINIWIFPSDAKREPAS